ncbi:MAG TPA: isoprenyl transferase [Luteibaculaceae bacterium]|nr:isoprenyl transferase [Luteibaculaceae bacterium]
MDTTNYKDLLNLLNVPKHVAIIMDGNGRWAKTKGEHRVFGHMNGVESVRSSLTAATEIGVEYLTLYAFSSENWNRPKAEVDALMELLVRTIHAEISELNKNGVKLAAIGNLETLPAECLRVLNEAIELTKNNSRITLVLALSYGSKEEITHAVHQIIDKIQIGQLQKSDLTHETIAEHLFTKHIPNPDLLIRTSGEHRISNFLLWQIAYAELYFTDVFWPDFSKNEFFKAVYSFQQRERRFGLTSEQIAQSNHRNESI